MVLQWTNHIQHHIKEVILVGALFMEKISAKVYAEKLLILWFGWRIKNHAKWSLNFINATLWGYKKIHLDWIFNFPHWTVKNSFFILHVPHLQGKYRSSPWTNSITSWRKIELNSVRWLSRVESLMKSTTEDLTISGIHFMSFKLLQVSSDLGI